MANPLFQLHLIAFDCIPYRLRGLGGPGMRGSRLRGNDGKPLRKRRMRTMYGLVR